MTKLNRNQSGFTLLEIMVASVILFASIAAVSMSYRGALISSQKADYTVQLSGMVEQILTQVRIQLNRSKLDETTKTGRGKMWGINYVWQATLVTKRSAPQKFDLNEEKFVVDAPRFNLWVVDLEIEKNGVAKQYSFNEVTWDEK